jgi:DNA-binding response OmpR family regulator
MHILLVEDEKKVAALIKRWLEEQGYWVDMAHDGAEGLQMALDGQYDLLVMDVMMPKKDGLTVVREFREHGKNTPVLMLTARDTVDDIVEGLDAGSDDYLTKPFAFAELSARVRALTRRSSMGQEAELYYSNLRMDLIGRKAWRGEREISLTVKEFALLEYMMRNPETVLSRNMIAEQAWENAFDSFSNIIDVYINYLRRKIDKGQERKIIHTVRGQGYMLRDVQEA